MEAFNAIDDILHLMAYHPVYLEHFIQTHNMIVRGDGPLSYDYRFIIAILAAGRHQCCCLMNQMKTEFLYNGGNPDWLNGLNSLPTKLKKLYEINKILAHRPWILDKSYIQNLTRGTDNWSLSELLHAIILLIHFHSLSTFVFSCGINRKLNNNKFHCCENVVVNAEAISQQIDSRSFSTPMKCHKPPEIPPLSPPSVIGEQEVKVETLMERMKDLTERSSAFEITQEELSKRFLIIEKQSAELTIAPQRSNSVLNSNIGLFIEDSDFIYQDFTRGKLNGAPTFRIQDYSWEDQGYSLVNSLYNDVGNLLDDKFKTAYNLTYNTMGEHSQVDTSRFRIAIWNYIQCIYGIKHDDYDYNEVNQLLERSLKTFIKNAVCYPERVTKKDYDRVMAEFKDSEKIHVNLIIFEARMQAELLYALRTIMSFVT